MINPFYYEKVSVYFLFFFSLPILPTNNFIWKPIGDWIELTLAKTPAPSPMKEENAQLTSVCIIKPTVDFFSFVEL